MRINWGTSIVIAFVLFMSFILFFVFKVQSDVKYDNELVTEDYYQKEMEVQGNIERQITANELDVKVNVEKSMEGIVINFPSNFSYKEIKGKVLLYRASNEKLDAEFDLELTSSKFLIPAEKLTGGIWEVTIEWEYEGVAYRNKESLYY